MCTHVLHMYMCMYTYASGRIVVFPSLTRSGGHLISGQGTSRCSNDSRSLATQTRLTKL